MGTLSVNVKPSKCNWKMSLFKGHSTRLLPSIYVVLLVLSLCLDSGSAHLILSKQCGDFTCEEHQYCSEFHHTCNSCSTICKEGSNNFSKDTCESGCQDYLHDERYIRLQGTSSQDGKDLGSLYQSLQKDVLILKILVGVCLVVISLILAAFSAFLVYFWRRIYDSGCSPKSKSTSSADKDDSDKKKDKKKGSNLSVIYDNKYGLQNSPEIPRVRQGGGQNKGQSPPEDGQSPSKVSTESMNSLNSAKTNGGITMSTLVNGSSGTNTPNGIINNRFRREPSESTIPEYMAYENPSPTAQGQSPITGQIYTHHV